MTVMNELPQIRRVGPEPFALDGPFWTGLAEGELRIQRCAACQRWIWSPHWRCGECGSWELDWPAVEMTGRVHAFSKTHYPFLPAMAQSLPFTNLLVELPQAGGARLLGLLVGSDEGLKVGAPVTGFIQPAAAEGELAALRWRLVGAGA